MRYCDRDEDAFWRVFRCADLRLLILSFHTPGWKKYKEWFPYGAANYGHLNMLKMMEEKHGYRFNIATIIDGALRYNHINIIEYYLPRCPQFFSYNIRFLDTSVLKRFLDLYTPEDREVVIRIGLDCKYENIMKYCYYRDSIYRPEIYEIKKPEIVHWIKVQER